MKKQIFLLDNISKKIKFRILIKILISVFLFTNCNANEKWKLDKNISKITFEVPVLFAKNIIGEFKNIDGYVEIDLTNKNQNKAIFSVEIESIEINYKKYNELVLSHIFFNAKV